MIMHYIKTYPAIIIAICSISICKGQDMQKAIFNDFNLLSGSWQGSLTYLDYTTGKPYTMAADVAIKRIGGRTKYAFANNYPKEQSANSVDTVVLSNDGRYINKELVKSRKVLPNGDIEIVTEEKGKDGNDHKPATFRHTYLIGKTNYSRKKEVQFQGETVWIKRHEYRYERKVKEALSSKF